MQLNGVGLSERIARARARLGVYGEQPKVTSNGQNPERIKCRSSTRSRSDLETINRAEVNRGVAEISAATRSGLESPSGKYQQPLVTN
jgi:hypothetical protein